MSTLKVPELVGYLGVRICPLYNIMSQECFVVALTALICINWSRSQTNPVQVISWNGVKDGWLHSQERERWKEGEMVHRLFTAKRERDRGRERWFTDCSHGSSKSRVEQSFPPLSVSTITDHSSHITHHTDHPSHPITQITHHTDHREYT